jgi:hypothetical protein
MYGRLGILRLESHTMNERRTLTLFGWTIGGVVGLMFVLNAFSLASLQKEPSANAHQLVSQAGHPGAATPSRLGYAPKNKGGLP